MAPVAEGGFVKLSDLINRTHVSIHTPKGDMYNASITPLRLPVHFIDKIQVKKKNKDLSWVTLCWKKDHFENTSQFQLSPKLLNLQKLTSKTPP